MKKLFVFDLDGTLLNHESKILPETIEAIKTLKKTGHFFAIATGRAFASSKIVINQCPYFDFAICNNGVVVKNLKTGKITINGKIEPELFDKLLDEAKISDSQITVSTNKNVYPLSLNNFNYPWMNLQEKMDYDAVSWSTPEIVFKALQKGETISQIALRNSEEVISQINKKMSSILSEKYSTFITNKVYYDVNPLGSDKSIGINTILNKLNLTTEDLAVFGDSGNDIKMIKMAKYSFAMSNGTPDSKLNAKEIIGNHNEPTIAEKLYQLK